MKGRYQYFLSRRPPSPAPLEPMTMSLEIPRWRDEPLKAYVHPNGNVQFYEEEDQDVVTLISSDGQAFKVHRQILIFNSSFWKDFLGLPANSGEAINLPETANHIYSVFYMMHQHEIDPSGEPDPKSLSHERPFARHASKLELARTAHVYFLRDVVKLLDKWQCSTSLRNMMEKHLIRLTLDYGSCVGTVMFIIACEQRWEGLAKESLKKLGGIQWADKSGTELDKSSWLNVGGLPFWMSEDNIQAIGWGNYQNLVGAVAESLKVSSSGKQILVDWEKVSEKFKLVK